MTRVFSINNISDLFKGALKPCIALLTFHVCWKFHPMFITSQPNYEGFGAGTSYIS